MFTLTRDALLAFLLDAFFPWLVGQILFCAFGIQTITITQVEPLAVMTDEQRQEAAAKRDLESQHLQCEVVFPGAVQRWGLANVVSMLYERSGTTIANYPGTTTSPQSWQASALWRSSLALASSSQDAPG